MPEISRELYKLARQIAEKVKDPKLQHARQLDEHYDSVRRYAANADKCMQRLLTVSSNGWTHGYNSVKEDLLGHVRYLRQSLESLANVASQQEKYEHAPATYDEILKDLIAIQDEFDEVEYDVKAGVITVTTEPITLEDEDHDCEQFLGSFSIVLKVRDLGIQGRGNYRVVANDPHPAKGNSSVTHPHVKSEELCEGEAQLTINMALNTGRLYDFFTIVNSVLNTYNDGSPYVHLRKWDGSDIECYECGEEMSEDESFYCEGCNHEYCGNCYSSCTKCDVSLCDGCISSCSSCEDSVCSNCLKSCVKCGHSVCEDCRIKCEECGRTVCDDCKDDNDLCPTCHNNRELEGDDEDDYNATLNAGSAVGVTDEHHLSRRQRRRQRHRHAA